MKTISNNNNFIYIYNNGDKKFTKYFVIYFIKNNKNETNFGLVISKKVGIAVIRNKLRRKMKNIIRDNEKNILLGWDIIIILKRINGEKNKISFIQLKSDLLNNLRKVGIYK